MIYLKDYNIKGLVASLRVWLFLLCVFSFTFPASAIELEGLFQASVPIDSRDNERSLQRAYSIAMSEVIIRVSGRTSAVNNSSIRRAINNAGSYVESWSIRASSDAAGGGGAQGLELEVSFYDIEIQRLLDNNNIPLWPANRQETLVWLVMQEELGRREVVGSQNELDNDVLELLRGLSEQRGLPILLPLMDIEDQFSINADEVWSLDQQALLSASQRYQTESILAMRLYRSLSGELLARSVYLFRGRVLPYQSYEDSLEDFVSSSISLASEELSGYYAVLISNAETDDSLAVNFSVEGIVDVKAYAELLNYIDDLTVVGSYQVTSVSQQQMVLTLSTGGQLRQLVETIALDDKLELIDDLRRNADGVFLYYRWLGI